MIDHALLHEQKRLLDIVTRQRKRIERVYGMTVKQWEHCFTMQGRKCACCKSPVPRSKIGWHVDHDHENGRVRGILCHGCNTAAGLLGDDPERVRQLAKYLGRTRAWHDRTQDLAA